MLILILVHFLADIQGYFSAQHKDWELAGSKMGNALGIKAPEEPEEDDGDENYDAKAGSQFKVPSFQECKIKFQGSPGRL